MKNKAVPILGFLAFALCAHAENNSVLWYDKPATDWEKEALPLGNGRIGAMVFGGVDSERLQISEKSLWTGGPGSEGGYDYGLAPESQAALMKSIGSKLLDDDIRNHVSYNKDEVLMPGRSVRFFANVKY